MANLVPNLLKLNGQVIEWNATAGTPVGKFMVNDPDTHATLSLQLADTNETDHDLFMIDENYTLITTQTIPYERALPALLVNVNLSDEWNASIEETFEIVVTAKPKADNTSLASDGNETVQEEGTFSAWWGSERPGNQGWVVDSAMGTFRPHNNGWLYHFHLGWVYASPTDDGSIWLWSAEHNWLWTRKDIFPFAYCWEDTNWLYFFFRPSGSFHIFNYATESYE